MACLISYTTGIRSSDEYKKLYAEYEQKKQDYNAVKKMTAELGKLLEASLDKQKFVRQELAQLEQKVMFCQSQQAAVLYSSNRRKNNDT